MKKEIIKKILKKAKESSKDGFFLMTTMYDEKNALRIKEFKTCLKKNLNHPLIDEIFIFFENKNHNNNLYKYICEIGYKLNIILIKNRPTFKDFFEYANNNFRNKKVIIANTDIYFDKTLYKTKNLDFSKKFFVLTRWNLADNNKLYLQVWKNPTFPWKKITKKQLMKNPHLQNQKSADAWFFQSPLKVDFDCDYQLGIFHSDTLLNHSLKQKESKGDLEVFNPCYSIKARHLDKNVGNKSLADYLRYRENYYNSEQIKKIQQGEVKWCHINDIG